MKRNTGTKIIREIGVSAGSDFISVVPLGGNILAPDSLPGVKKVTTYISDIRLSTGPDVYPIPPQRGTASLTLSSGSISFASVGIGGSAYKAVGSMSTAEKRLVISGDGTGAIVEISAVAAGVITGLTIVNAGTGYTSISAAVPLPTGEPLGTPWPDGIGYGLRSDNVYTLIINDLRSGLQHAIEAGRPFAFQSIVLLSGRELAIPWMI
jgi:hypothetical protein